MMRKTLSAISVLMALMITGMTLSCSSTTSRITTVLTELNHVTNIVPTNLNGIKLANLLNSLHVENYWVKGKYVNWETGVDIDGPVQHWATDSSTHCSGYVSSAAAILNVPLLHPPFPSGIHNGVAYTSLFASNYGQEFSNITATSDSLLANKQGIWLDDNAQEIIPLSPFTIACAKDWVHINAYQAQSFANQGYFTVVSYQNSNTSLPCHIAIIVPFQQETAISDYPNKNTAYTSLTIDGPYEAQSGSFNSSYTTVSRGFAPSNGPSVQWFGADSNKNSVKFYVYYMPINWSLVTIPMMVI